MVFRKKVQLKMGYVVLTTAMLFLAISLTVIFGIVNPVLAQIQNASRIFNSRESYFLAEAGIEDVIYRLKNGDTVNSSETLSIGGETVEITVVDVDGSKVITAEGNANNTTRKVEAEILGDTGAVFGNAVQVGNGGFLLSGGATVNGDIYSNGDIVGQGTINGDATAATKINPSTDQTNGTAFPPPNEITFGSNNAPQDFAQSFRVSTSTQVKVIRIYMKKSQSGWMNDITLRLTNDNGGKPAGGNITTVTIPAGQVSTAYTHLSVPLPSQPTLNPGTTYWIVLDTGSTWGAWYTVGASNNTYANGVAKQGTYNNGSGGTWSNTSPSGLDAYFEIVVGGVTAKIFGEGGSQYYQPLTVTGDAWAYDVTQVSVGGTNYCQVGANNNKSCNTSKSNPSPVGFPISDQNISTWKAGVTSAVEEEGWTYSGNLTIGSSGTTTTTLRRVTGNLTVNGGGVANIGAIQVDGNVSISGGGRLIAGPVKVNGNITIGSNSLTLKDNLWVANKFTLQSGGTTRLDASMGSEMGVILVDGQIDLTGGGTFAGSGTAGSFPLLLTTSTCPAGAGCGSDVAVEMNGGAGAVVVVAQNGTIDMVGGTAAKALIGEQVRLSSGASVTYDASLLNPDFTGAPSGAQNIKVWKEVE